MLITTCTHCLARFRVTPQQLNLKQGQVRCGHCQKVFSGFEALERFPDDDTGSRILAARAAAASPATPTPQPEALKGSPFDSIPLDQLPEIQDDAAVEDSGPPTTPAPEPEPERAVETTAPAVARPSAMDLLSQEYAPVVEVRRPPRAWVFGCALLAVMLGMQLLYAFRAQVAQNYPGHAAVAGVGVRAMRDAACRG